MSVLRPAAIADIPAIAALARRIWHTHYPGIITTGQIDYMLARMYSAETLGEQVAHPHGRFLLAEAEGALAGFVYAEREAPGRCFIHKIYVNTVLHGRGIGAALMAGAEDFAGAGAEMRLMVARLNVKAINFYFTQGFRIEKTVDKDIGEGYWMNDFMMVKRV